MPAPKKNLPSSANVPLRRASPRLLEKKKSSIPTPLQLELLLLHRQLQDRTVLVVLL
jgi:hypothetical protein